MFFLLPQLLPDPPHFLSTQLHVLSRSQTNKEMKGKTIRKNEKKDKKYPWSQFCIGLKCG